MRGVIRVEALEVFDFAIAFAPTIQGDPGSRCRSPHNRQNASRGCLELKGAPSGRAVRVALEYCGAHSLVAYRSIGRGPPSGLSSTGNCDKELCKEDVPGSSDVCLELLGAISEALVVTAGFQRVELGPDLLREVRGTSAGLFVNRVSPTA